MADHTAIRFNVGIFGFLTSDGMQTEMIKSINSLLHEVHLRVADHIKPKQGRAGENASLDLYVCPKLAGDIWLKSFDDSDADFHCVTMDAADTSNPFVKNASSVTELGGGSGSFNETHTIIKYIAAQSDMIIALWDGDDQSSNGMIWNLLRIEVTSGIPCVWIDVSNPDQMHFFDRYASETFTSLKLKERIDELYAGMLLSSSALANKPPFLSQLWGKFYNRYINKYRAQVKQLPFEEDALMNPALSGQEEDMSVPNQKRLAEQFNLFDGIALQFAKKYRESIYFRSILPLFLAIAISVGFYIETLFGILYKFQGSLQNFWMFIAGIGFLLHALINVYGEYIYRCKDIQDRHSIFLSSRYLAEYMRVAVHFLPFGIPLPADFAKNKDISVQVRHIFRSLEPASHTYSQSSAQNVIKHSLLLLNDQLAYHTNTRSRLDLVVKALDKSSKVMLWVGFGFVFFRGLLQFAMPFLANIPVLQAEYNGIKWINLIRSFTNMLALVLPAFAGYFSLKLSLNNFGGLYNHSVTAIENLKRLKEKAETLKKSGNIPYEMLAAFSQDILSTQLKEVEDWYSQTAAKTVPRL